VSSPSHPEDSTHVVQCPICGTRMSIFTNDVGKDTECPDCGHVFEIKSKQIELNVPKPIVSDEDDYGLKDVDESHDYARHSVGRKIYESAEEELRDQKERGKLSHRTPGAFDNLPPEDNPEKNRERLTPDDYDPRAHRVEFPLTFAPDELVKDAMIIADVGLLMRWVFLSIFTAITLYLGYHAITLGSGEANFLYWVSSMMCTTAAVVIGAATCVFLASIFLFVVMSVSGGVEDWDWPDTGVVDRVMEAMFLVSALFVSAIPFGVLYTSDSPLAILSLLLVFFLFPLLYLSALDQGSFYIPVSGSIFGSLLAIPHRWLLFYAATGLLLLGVSGAGFGFYKFAPVEKQTYLALPFGVLFVGYLLVYGIWLGRLAWEISEYNGKLELENRPSEETEKEF